MNPEKVSTHVSQTTAQQGHNVQTGAGHLHNPRWETGRVNDMAAPLCDLVEDFSRDFFPATVPTVALEQEVTGKRLFAAL